MLMGALPTVEEPIRRRPGIATESIDRLSFCYTRVWVLRRFAPEESPVARGPLGSSVLLSTHGIGGAHDMNALSAYRCERFAQGVEDVIGSDDVAQPVAVQIRQQRRFGVNQHQRYAVAN